MSSTGKSSGQLMGLEISFDDGITYQPLGAVVTKSRNLTISNVDVTDDNSNDWNEFVETLRNETVSMSGFTDTRGGANQGPLLQRFEIFAYNPSAEGADESKLFIRLSRPAIGGQKLRTFGCYQVSTVNIEASVDGAIGYSFEATSSGKIQTEIV